MSDTLATIKTFRSQFEADVMISKLASAGIAAFAANQDTVLADPSTVLHGRFDLKVHKEDAQKALDIINNES